MKIINILFVFFMIFTFVKDAHALSQNNAENYAQKAHEYFDSKKFRHAGYFYEKAYRNEKNPVYLDNAVAAYMQHAFNCSNEKFYEEAIKYCQKVLTLKPGNKDAKEIMAEVYLKRGSNLFYRGFIREAEKDIRASLKYCVLPEQVSSAKGLLSKINEDKKPTLLQKRSGIQKMSNTYSLNKTLELMELKIYGETYGAMAISKRVQNLENEVFETTYNNNSLVNRINRLKKRIMPELMSKS